MVSPAGCRPETFWGSLTSGISAVSGIRRFDASSYPTRIAAEVTDFRLEDHADLPRDWKDLGRIGQYAGAAASLALEDSRLLRNGSDRGRIGVLIAAGMGSYGHREVFGPCSAARSRAEDSFDWNAFAQSLASVAQERSAETLTPGSIPTAMARRWDLRGPVMSVMTACAAGTQALGDAARWIREGQADAVVAGGSDSELYPMGLASFCLLGALSTRNAEPSTASRPFDASRDGFVIGEGSGVLVLEEMGHAVRRGAPVYAEIAGFGSACDSYRVTDPHPEGKGAVLAMGRALDQAGVAPSAVGYINAHGTSTVANDQIETVAIKRLFGKDARRIPVSSTKSLIGHLTVAAGAVEAIATALTLFNGRIHPTINYERPDPSCDLDYVPKVSREASLEYALSNSFALRRAVREPSSEELPAMKRLLARLSRKLFSTWSLRGFLPDGSVIEARQYPFGRQIFATCEGDAIALAAFGIDLEFTVLIAPGRDGDLATVVAEGIGWRAVRGATRRGGTAALREMIRRLLASDSPGVVSVDGPLGPPGEAKEGILLCARDSGRPIVPVGAAARHRIPVPGAWSGLFVPLPFTRIAAVAGEPLSVPRQCARAELRPLARELTRRIGQARARAGEAVRAWPEPRISSTSP